MQAPPHSPMSHPWAWCPLTPRCANTPPLLRSYPDGSGRWALFRLPQGTKVKGTCIFIHGCKHDPMSWFYKSDRCQDCTGGWTGAPVCG